MTITEQLEDRRRADEAEMLKTAAHEAAHSVVTVAALGGTVSAVSLVPGPGKLGATYGVSELTFRDHVVVNLASLALGEAAGWPDAVESSRHDIRRAHEFARRIAGPDGDTRSIIADEFQRARVLVREHWVGIWSFARVLAGRTYLAGEELTDALEAAVRLSPSERALDAEFGRLRAVLDREHVRRDLRQRVLWQAPIHKSSTISSPSAAVLSPPPVASYAAAGWGRLLPDELAI
jgi:hypothetical protein